MTSIEAETNIEEIYMISPGVYMSAVYGQIIVRFYRPW